MRIAICDDNHQHVNITEDFLGKFKKQYKGIEWDAFYNGEELIKFYEENGVEFDLIFLDMEMNNLNGIETANNIRKKDKHVIIIFVTSHISYMQRSFECEPFRFLVKPVTFEDFNKAMIAVIAKLGDGRETVIFNESKNRVRLFCDDILFFENNSHWISIYTKERQYKVYKTFNALETQLDNKIFVKSHKSFIVNLSYIKEIHRSEIILHNYENSIPISRNLKKVLVDSFIEYKERKYML